jgi:hypothetical protein
MMSGGMTNSREELVTDQTTDGEHDGGWVQDVVHGLRF